MMDHVYITCEASKWRLASHTRSLAAPAEAVEWAWACHDMTDEECFLLNVIKCYYSKTKY